MKQLVLLSLLFFCMALKGFSQSGSFYGVSVVGSFSQGMRASSLVQSFNKRTECLQLNTGLYLYYGVKGNSRFELTCQSGSIVTPVDIRLFPNPVRNYVRLEGSGISENDQNLSLSLYDAAGKRLWEQVITVSQLIAGTSFFWGWLQSGNYYLRVDGEELHRVIPFIKLN
ncbi:MAG: Secretion system C-terminal sorting domain [Bacteroidota bacterium]|jgi:hypothetical protein